MYKRLEGKSVFITGASAGIGEACAKQFAACGSNLILTARREEKLQAIRDELKQTYPDIKIHVAKLDVSQCDQVDAVVNALPDEFKNIDILVNNAGLAKGVNYTVDNVPEDINTVIDVNIKGVLYVTRAIVPGMIERKSGHVVNVSSVAGLQAYKGGSVYCATKHAVQAITNSLRKEVVDKNIRVTSICPGLVETEFSVVRFSGDQNRADSVYKGLEPLVCILSCFYNSFNVIIACRRYCR